MRILAISKTCASASRSEGFGAEEAPHPQGTYALSAGYDAYYKRAQKVRRLIRDDFSRAFKDVDVIMAPIRRKPPLNWAPRRTTRSTCTWPTFTIAVNLAGLPALSMPSGFINGLPAGTQAIGNYFQEGLIERGAPLSNGHGLASTGAGGSA